MVLLRAPAAKAHAQSPLELKWRGWGNSLSIVDDVPQPAFDALFLIFFGHTFRGSRRTTGRCASHEASSWKTCRVDVWSTKRYGCCLQLGLREVVASGLQSCPMGLVTLGGARRSPAPGKTMQESHKQKFTPTSHGADPGD